MTILHQTGEQWSVIKYKTEIIVSAVMSQVQYLQLLPDLLVRWKPKDGYHAFFTLIICLTSLLEICEILRDVSIHIG